MYKVITEVQTKNYKNILNKIIKTYETDYDLN